MIRATALIVALAVLVAHVAPQRTPPVTAANCGGNVIVNTTTDTVAVSPATSPNDGGGNISLRSAIMYANAHAGADTICLDPTTYTLTLGAADADGVNGLDQSTGDLDIFGDTLTIIGLPGTIVQAGTTKASSAATGNGIDRVFHIDSVNVTMSNFTIRNGKGFLPASLVPGGGIYLNSLASPATLALTNMTITDNLSNDSGGGMANVAGVINMTNTTVSNNVAIQGGGISTLGGGQVAPALNVLNSTVSGNSAAPFVNPFFPSNGGGIYGTAGTLGVTSSIVSTNSATSGGGGIYVFAGIVATITGSTISGNTAGTSGGGVFNRATTTLTNSTVSGNQVTTPTLGGGGIYSGFVSSTLNTTNVTIADNKSLATGGQLSFGGGGSVFNARNTILAQGGSGSAGNCFNVVAITSLGGNLSSDATCPLPGVADKMNTNPLLQALANNGGPTQTHMLGAGSPAIDAGTNTGCPATDQRGLPRPTDGDGNGSAICDSGAVEVAAVVVNPPTVTKAFAPTSILSGGTTTLTLSFDNPNASVLTNLSIIDTLPPGMTVAPTPNVVQTCGGTVTAVAGSNSVTLTGGSLGANASCSVSVSVTATGAPGPITNTTGNVSSQQSGNGATASAPLTILPAALLPAANTPTPTPIAPTPPATPFVPMVIPQQVQNPAAIQAVLGGIGNGTRNNTPVPSRPAAVDPASAAAAAAGPLVITPPRTGDAGLAPHPTFSIFDGEEAQP